MLLDQAAVANVSRAVREINGFETLSRWPAELLRNFWREMAEHIGACSGLGVRSCNDTFLLRSWIRLRRRITVGYAAISWSR